MAFAEKEFEIKDGILYRYCGFMKTDAVIPEGVAIIGEKAFSGCENLIHVTLPESVTQISDGAFAGCTGLVSVRLPRGVTAIGNSAFCDCRTLESIELPAGIAQIGEAAFNNCKSITSVTVPEGITEIKQFTFWGCEKLASAVLPDSLRTVGNMAFRDCKSLLSVPLPAGVAEFGDGIFCGCKGLADADGFLIFRGVLQSYFGGRTTVNVPYGVTEIGNFAFSGCKDTAVVTVPDSVTRIGGIAFLHCPDVTVVCSEGSYAQEYCLNKKIRFIFDYQFNAYRGVLPPGIEKREAPFLADEEKPFVFISYSHKDRDTVVQIIKKLYEDGWKIWYDEGLTVGDRYDETLEAHIKECAAFLLFVTKNTVNSNYVKEFEIPWALRYGKPIIQCPADPGADVEIDPAAVAAVAEPAQLGQALERIGTLSRGERRTAKGISVVVNPADRTVADGGFAYCLYAADTAAKAKTVLLDALNSGCALYDAAENGESEEKLHAAAVLIVFLDCAFLRDAHLTAILREAFAAGKDIAVCLVEKPDNIVLPRELNEMHRMQWLNFMKNNPADMNAKLARHLQKRGCRNAAVLPGFDYEKTDAGIVITRYTGMSPAPRIEPVYGGVPVVKIADQAFKNCIRLKEIVIPYGVTAIGNEAFSGCTDLTSVTLPESVGEIGHSAFMNCAKLCSVRLPDGLTRISGQLFSGCAALGSVRVPAGVTEIGDMAFTGCGSLASVVLPQGVETVGWSAFSRTGLRNIELPESVTKIGEEAFQRCHGLVSVCVPRGVTIIEKGMFEGCANLASAILPEGVTVIGANAFWGCKKLVSAALPQSVTEIGSCAFEGCSALSSLRIPEGVTKTGDGVFRFCQSLTQMRLPEGIAGIGDLMFWGCVSLRSFDVPEGVTKLGRGAFQLCVNLRSVTIPESVTQIERDTFDGCADLMIFGAAGSAAERYAREQQIPFKQTSYVSRGGF